MCASYMVVAAALKRMRMRYDYALCLTPYALHLMPYVLCLMPYTIYIRASSMVVAAALKRMLAHTSIYVCSH